MGETPGVSLDAPSGTPAMPGNAVPGNRTRERPTGERRWFATACLAFLFVAMCADSAMAEPTITNLGVQAAGVSPSSFANGIAPTVQ